METTVYQSNIRKKYKLSSKFHEPANGSIPAGGGIFGQYMDRCQPSILSNFDSYRFVAIILNHVQGYREGNEEINMLYCTDILHFIEACL